MKAFTLFLLATLLISCYSCKREEQDKPVPLINIYQPAESQAYGYLDTVTVKALISHYGPIDYVRVAITDDQSTPVTTIQLFYPESNEFNLDAKLVFDNFLIGSGRYSIHIRAGADGEITNEWVNINYTASPRELVSFIAITHNQGTAYKVIELTSGNQMNELYSFSGDFSGSCISSRNHLLFTAGLVYGDLVAWDLKEGSQRWSVSSLISPPLPYFTSVYSDEKEVFASSREALINGYSESGLNTFRSKQFVNGYFKDFIRYKGWLISVFEPYSSPLNEIVVFNYPGGTVFRQLQFEGSVAGIEESDNDRVLIYMNKGNASSVSSYDAASNLLVKLKDFPQGRIRKITMPDTQNAYLAFEDGVYWFRPEIASIVKILPLEGVSALAFEPIAGKLLVARGNLVEIFQLPSTIPPETFTLSDTVVSMHLRYNK